MSLSPDAERSIATTIAAMLIAVATFSLTIMGIEKNALTSINNEIFGLLGLFALLTSALIIDSILDKSDCGPMYRFTELMNGGYFLFCLIMAAMSFGIFFMYLYQEAPKVLSGWNNIYVLLIISSLCLFIKLMWDDSEQIFVPLLIVSYTVSILVVLMQKT